MSINAPYGPYSASKLLLPGRNRPHIPFKSVVLRQGESIIGFDRLDNEKKRNEAGGIVLIKGVVSVKREMLTDEGCLWMDRDLTDRANKPMRLSEPRDVIVVAELYAFPVYNYGNGYFEITTRDSVSKVVQHFIIESMQVHAYRLSRDYIAKYVLFETIAKIVEANSSTLVSARTPRWLVSQYLRHERIRGVYYNDEDDECETYTPRNVHRAEVYNLLAKYCEEIRDRITKEASSHKLDYLTWTHFCQIVQERRNGLNASRNCDELDATWPEPEETPEPQPEVAPQRLEDEVNNSNTFIFTYNDSGSYEDDKSSYLYQHTPIPYDVYQALPLKLLGQVPVIDFSLTWKCPEDDCSHEVDFVHPPDWMREKDYYEFLRRGEWDRQHPRFLKIFFDEFESHLHDHLNIKGIKRLAKMRHPDDYADEDPRIETVQLSEPGRATVDLLDYHYAWAKNCARFRQAPSTQ